MEHLPPTCPDYETYFRKVTALLQKYHWLYDFRGIHLFQSDALTQLPSSWASTFQQLTLNELNELPLGITKTEWPTSLQLFVQECRQLHLRVDDYDLGDGNHQEFQIPQSMLAGMSPKKRHEVHRLGQLICSHCRKRGCKHVVDVGAGLGYLDHVLHSHCNLHVLGLDAKVSHVEAAKLRLSKKSSANQCPGLQHLPLVLGDPAIAIKALTPMMSNLLKTEECTCDTKTREAQSVRDTPTSPIYTGSVPVCLLGLHSCGDLSPIILHLFCRCPQFHILFLVPCCYHKMAGPADGKEGSFTHFPLSLLLQSHSQQENKWVSSHLLRLAAQKAPSQWPCSEEKHRYHSRRVVYRALLQLYVDKEGLELKKKRRGIHRVHLSSVDSYVEAAMSCYGLPEQHKKPLLQLFEQNKPSSAVVEGLSALQVLLQPLCEHLVLADRLFFLQEQKCHVRLMRVFDDSISPRSTAFIATKS